MLQTNKKIVFKAPVLTLSGYGVHARQVAHTLIDLFPDNVEFIPTNWGNTGWLVNDIDGDGLYFKIRDRICVDQNKKFDISLQLLLPDEWDVNLAKYNIGLTAGVETDKCSPHWIECCNKMDLILVPSKFTKETFLNSGKIEKEIIVTGEETYVDEEYWNNKQDLVTNNIFNDKIKNKNNILIFGQLTGNNPYNDRKNIFLTFKSIFELFAEKKIKDTGIVLKTNSARNTTIDREFTVNTFQNIIGQLRTMTKSNVDVQIIHGTLTKDETFQLYTSNKIKAIINLSRGEGWGLPLIEGASANLPVIAVNWSGHLDFLNYGKFIKVNYDLKEIHESRIDNRIFFKGFKWAEYDEKNFKNNLDKFLSAPSLPREWAKDLGAKLRVAFAHKTITEKYKNILEKLV